MKLQKCANGHFYDGDKFAACPHCAGGMNNIKPNPGNEFECADYNVAAKQPVDMKTQPLTTPPAGTPYDEVTRPISYSTSIAGDPGLTVSITDIPDTLSMSTSIDQTEAFQEDGPTIGLYHTLASDGGNESFDPPVGWLICIAGKQRGRDFRLLAGLNSIGRSADMAVCLSGEETVSRSNHASVVFEPKQNKFYAVPGNSRALAYLNNEVLLTRTVMKKNDRLELGKAILMLIPCCDDAFRWE